MDILSGVLNMSPVLDRCSLSACGVCYTSTRVSQSPALCYTHSELPCLCESFIFLSEAEHFTRWRGAQKLFSKDHPAWFSMKSFL